MHPTEECPSLYVMRGVVEGENHKREDAIMNEEQKREVAVFRFSVIHDLVGGTHLERGDQQRLLRQKCERKWVIPHSSRTRLTRGTILRWVQRYKESNGKLESLCPIERSDRGVSRGLDEETSLAHKIIQSLRSEGLTEEARQKNWKVVREKAYLEHHMEHLRAIYEPYAG